MNIPIPLKNNQQIKVKGFKHKNIITVHTSPGQLQPEDEPVWVLKHPSTLTDTHSSLEEARKKEAYEKAVELTEGDIVIVEDKKYTVKVNGELYEDPITFDSLQQTCLSHDTKILVGIKKITETKNVIEIELGSMFIRASKNHFITVNRNGKKEIINAEDIKFSDTFSMDVSSITSDSKIITYK